MKIGVLTIIFIIWILMTGFAGYTDKKILDMWGDTCNELSPIDSQLKLSDSQSELFQDCMYKKQLASTQYGMMMFVTFIFFSLALLSWKVDNFKKH